MAKKMNQAERVLAMLEEEKVRAYISKCTLHPAVLLGGTKTDSEERVQYRCAHCRHEWEILYRNHYSRHTNTVICPQCKQRMFPGVKIPTEGEHYSCSFRLWDGVQLKNFRYLLYMDAAAPIMLGVRNVVVRLFVEPDVDRLIETNPIAGSKLKQIAFDKAIVR